MGISHIFTSPIADGTNTQLVRPSDWNSAHTYQLQDAVSISGGNTAGVLANISTGTFYMAGSNNITLSQNANSVSFSGPTLVDMTLGGNTAGTLQAITSGTFTLAGGNNITLSQSGSGISIVGPPTISNLVPTPWDEVASATTTFGLGTLHVNPFLIPQPLDFDQVMMIGSGSLGTTSLPNTVTVSFGTSGQSLQAEHNFSFTASNLFDLYLFSRQTGGSSTDLGTVFSTENSVVTFMSQTFKWNATAGAASQTGTMSQTMSIIVSYPWLTSATSTSVNAATTVTLWGTGYSSWTSTATNSTTSSKTTGATMSISIASTFPATTGWASNKLWKMNFDITSVMQPGQYWFGFARSSSTSSSSSSANTSVAAGRTYTTAFTQSNFSFATQVTFVGGTTSIASSIAEPGQQTASSLGPMPGYGTFTATFDPTKTYMNNAGQANGEIALSDINTNVSFWKPYIQFAWNRN